MSANRVGLRLTPKVIALRLALKNWGTSAECFRGYDKMDVRKSAISRADHQRQAAAMELEREHRALRLSPGDVAYWTKAVATVAAMVAPADRPCSYRNWTETLNEYARARAVIGAPPKYTADLPSRLMSFAEDLAHPDWTDPRPDLVEFALVFLEADVMLFRSGYTKRHLIKRLQKCALIGDQVDRVDGLLRRSITEGAGLEECRAYRRLAAKLVADGDLKDLPRWLEGARIKAPDPRVRCSACLMLTAIRRRQVADGRK